MIITPIIKEWSLQADHLNKDIYKAKFKVLLYIRVLASRNDK